MNKINVTYQNKLYAWIDTIVKKEEYTYLLAVLVDPYNGKVFSVNIREIEVIDLDIRL